MLKLLHPDLSENVPATLFTTQLRDPSEAVGTLQWLAMAWPCEKWAHVTTASGHVIK